MGSLPVTVGINDFLSLLGGEGRQSRPWVQGTNKAHFGGRGAEKLVLEHA